MAEAIRDALLRRRAVQALTGMSRSGIYAAIERGAFPKPVCIGDTRSVGWVESQVQAWINQQIAASQSAPSSPASSSRGSRIRAVDQAAKGAANG